MSPLPRAPSLPDLGEVLRRATEEGIKQGLALAREDEGKQLPRSLSVSMGSDSLMFNREVSRQDQA